MPMSTDPDGVFAEGAIRTIHKYPFHIYDRETVCMPEGAKILKIEMQRDVPFLWALVDTEAAPIDHHFLVFGTGRPIGRDLRLGGHVATFQAGPFVWHVFEDNGV
jgi:hypothetical protein